MTDDRLNILRRSLAQPRRNGRTLNLKLSLHRFFTFPRKFKTKFSVDPHLLAEVGLYCKNNNEHKVSCINCNFQVDSRKLQEMPEIHDKHKFVRMMQEKHKCKIASNSTNIPVENVKSVLNYMFEAHRLYSLLQKEDWKYVDLYSLAKSGFYYTGDGDNCRCVFCNLEIRGWEEGDTAEGEHTRWNPLCPFLKDPSSVTNIEIGNEQLEVGSDGIGQRHDGANPFTISPHLEHCRPYLRLKVNDLTLTPDHLNIKNWSPPKYQRYTTFNSRLDSFKQWPKSLNQTPLSLAQAGLFYIGAGDETICFYCNLKIKDWQSNDDPFIRHLRDNFLMDTPTCLYLNIWKGPAYISEVTKSNFDLAVVNQNDPCFDMKCQNCRDRSISKINLPCSHMTLCHLCESDANCVQCNGMILAEMRVPGL